MNQYLCFGFVGFFLLLFAVSFTEVKDYPNVHITRQSERTDTGN